MTDRTLPMGGTRLLDQYMEHFDFNEIHSIPIPATAEQIFPEIHNMDLNSSRVTRLLFSLRGFPSNDIRLENMVTEGPFRILDTIPDREIFIGLLTNAWIQPTEIEDVDTFTGYGPKRGIKIGWNFSIQPDVHGCRLRTETRVQCFGPGVRITFGLYWLGIRAFSGWIRMEMLKAVKHQTLKLHHI
ncbi:MAG: hypothetical protein MI747_16620 [Desulfobacterales bacterium]|nr:hypothetical protein [Desulfobacterales bacterium]